MPASGGFNGPNPVTLRGNNPNRHGSRSEPSLEDVFIDLMGRAKDNFQ